MTRSPLHHRRPPPTAAGVLVGALLSLGAVLLAAPARAQVDVEALRRKLDDDGLALKLSSGISGFNGNSNGVVLTGNGLAGGRRGAHLGLLAGDGNFTRFGGVTTVFRGYGHLRYAYRLQPWVQGEVFGQIEADRFRRWDLRSIAGVGPRFAIVTTEAFTLNLGTAYMAEDILLSESVRDEPVRPRFVHRWSTYLAAQVVLHERIELTHTTYLQPRFDALEDIRMFTSTNFQFTVTDLVSTGFGFSVRLEDPPLPGVQATDLTVSQNLSLTL